MTLVRKGFIQNQALQVLNQKKYALVLVTLLAALPYMDWLALTLVGLVTLHHGMKAGSEVLWPVLLMRVLISIFSLSWPMAVAASVLHVLPSYLMACVLKQTVNWRFVSMAMLALLLITAVILQVFLPDFALQQYVHLEALLQQVMSNQAHTINLWHNQQVSTQVLAHYFLGIQGASLAFSAVVPLLFARALQSQLFYPGGFRQEMTTFRGAKIDFVVLLLLLALGYSEYALAMNCLPFVILCFVFSGLSLGAYIFSNMRPMALMLLLIAPMIFLSWVFLPLYALLGALDSLFNFRLYLSEKTEKVT